MCMIMVTRAEEFSIVTTSDPQRGVSRDGNLRKGRKVGKAGVFLSCRGISRLQRREAHQHEVGGGVDGYPVDQHGLAVPALELEMEPVAGDDVHVGGDPSLAAPALLPIGPAMVGG